MAAELRAPIPCVVTLPVDPILAAIGLHRRAWSPFAIAPPAAIDGAAPVQRGALADLLGTPCTTPAGSRSLLLHLRACLASNGSTLRLDGLTASLVTARASDLALLLGLPGARAPIPLGEAAASIVHSLNRAAGTASARPSASH